MVLILNKNLFPDYTGPNRYREASMYVWERFEDVKGMKNLFTYYDEYHLNPSEKQDFIDEYLCIFQI